MSHFNSRAFCKRRHPRTPDNVDRMRRCITCEKDRQARAAEKRRLELAALKPPTLPKSARRRRDVASRIHPRILALIEECRPIYEAAIANQKISPLVLFGRAH